MKCIQVNHSFSLQNVVRGLHFQTNPAQKKLVGVASGVIIDVAVDLRVKSPTFGKHFKIKIESPDTLLYIPEGFGHGFSVLSPEGANLIYVVEGEYSKIGDGGVIYNDAELGIDWEVKNPIVSSKDELLQTFADYKKKPLF
jgi:dTDP-4-dehydrorhamnose 3,5-epimerase